jgi:malonyl-CoA O-methyltransferase
MSDSISTSSRYAVNFGRAATSYEKHDVLQRKCSRRCSSAWTSTRRAQRIIDVGAGTGRGSALLKKRYAKAEVIAVDLALPMLRAAKQHASWLEAIPARLRRSHPLPLADHSVDVLHSNLCFQWIDDLPALFGECVRVLKPGGLLAFSTFGPDTLKELRASWAEADQQPHVSRFPRHARRRRRHARGRPARPGIRCAPLHADLQRPRKLLEELQGLGATNADQTRERGLTGKARYQRMLAAYETMRVDGRIPATWEVVTAHAWGPPQGQGRRGTDGSEIASFSVDSLRGTRRCVPPCCAGSFARSIDGLTLH